ncbi:MAG: DUF4397 domain-containing protein [Thermonemataceae bacterium]|nr:DUF4397 domain-containing protein [Thermonemataceae bacterium]
MKNIKNILLASSLIALAFSCRPEYPEPEVNTSSVAPLAKKSSNNTQIAVFNALYDANPEENALSRLLVNVDGVALANLDGKPAYVWSKQFTYKADGITLDPLVRKYPAPSGTFGAAGAEEQSSTYTSNPFTTFTEAKAASIINGVEVSPAVQETGVFIAAGRRNITFTDKDGNTVSSLLRYNADFAAGKQTSIFLRGRLGETTGTQVMGVTAITESFSTPSSGNASVRFLNLSPDATISEVQLLNASSKAPILKFPSAPSGTQFKADRLKPTAVDTLKAIRDSVFSLRKYNQLSNTVSASSLAKEAGLIETTNDNTLIPNYSWSLNFGDKGFSTITAGSILMNVYAKGKRQTKLVPKDISFSFASGKVYTVVFHGTYQTGYKLDIIQHN